MEEVDKEQRHRILEIFTEESNEEDFTGFPSSDMDKASAVKKGKKSLKFRLFSGGEEYDKWMTSLVYIPRQHPPCY